MLGQGGVNMSYACKICEKSFATSSNRARHEKTFHGTRISSETNFPINTATVLQHPFTCIVDGCTQSGKDRVSENSFGECSENDKSTSSTHNLVL